LAEVVQRIIDPQLHPTGVDEEESALPGSERDLAIVAQVAAILVFNNLSSMKPAISDALCRMASGGRLDQRSLYTNDGIVSFSARRFIVLAGISEEIVDRADLRDRTLAVHLLPIEPNKRIAERDFYSRFEAMRPRILGALLTAVSTALKNLSSTPASPYRMSEFVRFVQAAEPAMPWEPGDFLRAYRGDRHNAAGAALDISAMGQVISILVRHQPVKNGYQQWKGTVTQLLNEWIRLLEERRLSSGAKVADDIPPCSSALRNNFRVAGTELARIAPALREMGFTYTPGKSGSTRPHLFSKQFIPPVPSANLGKGGGK
jgi:hypothetical protein